MHQSANVAAAVGTVYPDQQANVTKYIQFASTSFRAITMVIAFGEMKENGNISSAASITEQTTLSREWTSSSETSSPVTLAVFSNLTVAELIQSRGSLAGEDRHDQRNDSPPTLDSMSRIPGSHSKYEYYSYYVVTGRVWTNLVRTYQTHPYYYP